MQICQDGLFKSLEQWVRDRTKYGKLHSVSTQEQAEIDSLIRKTWDQRYVGAGKDAVGLKHRGVQVCIFLLVLTTSLALWLGFCLKSGRLRFDSRFPGGSFSKLSHTCNLKISTSVATLPGIQCSVKGSAVGLVCLVSVYCDWVR